MASVDSLYSRCLVISIDSGLKQPNARKSKRPLALRREDDSAIHAASLPPCLTLQPIVAGPLPEGLGLICDVTTDV